MDCDRARAQLTAYLDGELDGDAGTVVRGHLRTCAACRGVATDEAALRDGLRALPPVDPPSTLWANVQRQLANEEVREAQRPAWRRTLARWGRAIPAPRFVMVGALAAAATVALVVWKTRPSTDNMTVAHAIDVPAPKIIPDTPKPAISCREVAEADDVTEDLTRDAARSTTAYDCAIEELLTASKEVRSEWSGRERTQFDDAVKKMRDAIAAAPDGRPRKKANRALVSYLQKAVIRDEVLLAGAP